MHTHIFTWKVKNYISNWSFHILFSFSIHQWDTVNAFWKQQSEWFQVANVIMEVFGLPVRQYPCDQAWEIKKQGQKMCPLVVVAGIFVAGVDLIGKGMLGLTVKIGSKLLLFLEITVKVSIQDFHFSGWEGWQLAWGFILHCSLLAVILCTRISNYHSTICWRDYFSYWIESIIDGQITLKLILHLLSSILLLWSRYLCSSQCQTILINAAFVRSLKVEV